MNWDHGNYALIFMFRPSHIASYPYISFLMFHKPVYPAVIEYLAAVLFYSTFRSVAHTKRWNKSFYLWALLLQPEWHSAVALGCAPSPLSDVKKIRCSASHSIIVLCVTLHLSGRFYASPVVLFPVSGLSYGICQFTKVQEETSI